MDNDDPNRERRNPPQGSRPASPEEVEDAIGLILEGFGGRSTNADKFKAYAMALEGLSAESLARGVKAILRGEIADLDPAFPPTTAQLVKACKPVTFLSPGWIAANDETLRLRDYKRAGFEPLGDVTLTLARQIEGDAAHKSAERLRRVAAEMAAHQPQEEDKP